MQRIAEHPVTEERQYLFFQALNTAMHRKIALFDNTFSFKSLRYELEKYKTPSYLVSVWNGAVSGLLVGLWATLPEHPQHSHSESLKGALRMSFLVTAGSYSLTWYLWRMQFQALQSWIYSAYDTVSEMIDAAIANGLASEALIQEWNECKNTVEDLWDSSSSATILRGSDRLADFFDMIKDAVSDDARMPE